VGPATWIYDLTFAPQDNYSINQPSTTITLTGLKGVTAATGPTSTDWTGALNVLNLAWTAQVLNGGTTVVWTHVGAGTGNMPTTMHAYGFTVTAADGVNGNVSLATSGFAQDGTGGANLDISGTVAGPAGPAVPAAAPVGGPLPLALTFLALCVVGGYFVRRQFRESLRHS